MNQFLVLSVFYPALALAQAPSDVGEGIRVIHSAPAVAAKSTRRAAPMKAARPNPLKCSFEISTVNSQPVQAPANGKSATKGDLRRVVKIDLPKKHPGKLAIVSPDGNWHYMHDELEAHQLGKGFGTARGLELDIAKVKSQKAPKAKMEPVFRHSGTYTFYFAENLETEMANTFFLSCKLPIRVD